MPGLCYNHGMTTKTDARRQAERIAFDMYVDCLFNYAEAARQLGVSRSTVRGRVRRAALRDGGNLYSTRSVNV